MLGYALAKLSATPPPNSKTPSALEGACIYGAGWLPRQVPNKSTPQRVRVPLAPPPGTFSSQRR